MNFKKTFFVVALIIALPAFVTAMTNEGALTDTTTTTTSSGTYNDDGSASSRN